MKKCKHISQKFVRYGCYFIPDGVTTWLGECTNCGEIRINPIGARLTKRALDGAKAPRKSKRSMGSPRK